MTVLTLVMIGGVLTIVVLLVIRLQTPATAIVWPDPLDIPIGEVPLAVTAGPGWTLVVTQSGEALIFDADGKLTARQTLPLPEAQ